MANHKHNAIQVLLEAGWQVIGEQPTRVYKTYSQGSPLPNALIKFGGRMRLCLPGTDRRCTVGPRTVCFFVYDGKECSGFVSVKTRDVDEIIAVARNGVACGTGSDGRGSERDK